MKEGILSSIMKNVRTLFVIDENATDHEVDQILSDHAENKEKASGLIATLETNISKQLDTQLASIADQNKSFTEMVAGIQKEISELKNENSTLKSEIKTLTENATILKTELAGEISALKTTEGITAGETKVFVANGANVEKQKPGTKTMKEIMNPSLANA